MTLNDLENTMVVKLRNGGLYVVFTDVRIFSDNCVDKVTTIFAAIKELDEFGSKEVTFY